MVSDYRLKPATFDLASVDSEEVYYARHERSPILLHGDLSRLGDGDHHLPIQGCHFTVRRRGTWATIYVASAERFRGGSSHLSMPFWGQAVTDIAGSSAICDDLDARIRTEAFGIVLRRADLARKWPDAQFVPEKRNAKNPGGRPREWDWEGALIEMARIHLFEKAPKTQKGLAQRIKLWFDKEYKDTPVRGKTHPGDTLLDPRVRAFWRMRWPKSTR